MKSLSSRLHLLILLFAVAAIALTFRSLARRCLAFDPVFSPNYQSTSPPIDPNLNASIFRVAAVDDSAPDLRTQVHDLLHGKLDYTVVGNFRLLTLWPSSDSHPPARPATRLRFSPNDFKFERAELFAQFRRLLVDWFRNRDSFQPSVMSEIIPAVKIPIDRHYGRQSVSERHRYPSCAVVGNSGILLNGDHGELIDGHDVVIRLNNARTGGYERHVGTKTTIAFVNSNILHTCALLDRCTCHPYGEGVPIVFYVCQPAHLLDYAVCNSSHAAPLLATDGRFDALCSRLVKYYSVKSFVEETGNDPTLWGKFHDEKMFHYSSGMQAIMVAVGMCDRVSVFGFGKSVNAKHHYHTNQRSELGLHDYEAEYELYRDLSERPEIVPFLNEAGIKVPPVIFYR